MMRNLGRCVLFLLALVFMSPSLVLFYDGARSGDYSLIADSLPGICQVIVPTLVVCGGGALVAILFGTLAGLLLFKTRLPGRHLLIALVALGLALPAHVHTSTWLILLGRRGLLAPWLPRSFSLNNSIGALWITAVHFTPLATLLCGLAFANVSGQLRQQCSCYLNFWQQLWHVLIANAAAGLASAWLIVFIFALGEMTITDVLGVDTLARKIYLLLALEYRPDLALMLSLALMALVFLYGSGLYSLLRYHGIATLEQPQPAAGDLIALGYYQLPALTLVLATFWYLLALPVLIWRAGTIGNMVTAYRSTAPELWNSLIISSGAALIIAITATMVAWLMRRHTKLAWMPAVLALWLALMPAPLTGIGILRLVARGLDLPLLGRLLFWLRDSRWLVVLGLLIRFWPYALLLSVIGLRSIPRQLEETVALAGCPPWRQILVLLPLSKRTFLLALLTAFVFSLGELATTILIVPPGTTTLSVRIFTLLHYGVRADVACCSLFVVAFLLAAILVGYWLWRLHWILPLRSPRSP